MVGSDFDAAIGAGLYHSPPEASQPKFCLCEGIKGLFSADL